ncbi:MFS transporter [Amycolatopsis jiangsuensis]|uniref:DHA1 family bicyclomycin/chloramphenicol resistance-like MFS transporter n=1 Tax=Amycolatopsis jiangsuensis TaxID=1181879 RepID=A0A840IQ49_9PSEU|nr:hypothetical protein [Amycolatopsis jiangsuensis]MBB4683575.1 DHA1 family bicyclomycin/chloramphenicol resistance-like MFS transporter [Amycolatopsis jiangsuensis]
MLVCAVVIAVAGGAAQVLAVVAFGESFAAAGVTLFVVLAGIGMIFPATMSLGQTIGGAVPGAASALMGGLQFACGAVASPLVGVFGEGSSLPMAVIMLSALVLAGLALVVLVRHAEGHREVAPALAAEAP